jgi:hypothetical protein
MRDAGVLTFATGRGRLVDKYIVVILSAVNRMARSRHRLDLIRSIHSLFDQRNCTEIKAICLLAPKWPDRGGRELFARNTEYPFQESAAVWRAPADGGSFNKREVDRFRTLADRVLTRSGKLVSLLKRAP